jgi:probable phosphoglycerate mutase
VLRVLLIRHGETAWNREGRWQGHANVPLAPEGAEQAERLAIWLRETHPDLVAVHSSDLDRATETARRIAVAYGLEPVVDPLWREMDVGEWSGLGRASIESRFAEEWQRIVAGEDLPRGGGETFAGFTRRILRGLETLAALRPAGTVAVVTHGGVIRAALLHLQGLPFARLREIARVGNTAFAELTRDGTEWRITAPTDARQPAAVPP